MSHHKNVWLPADNVSYALLYRNALDIHCKNTASHLHDEVMCLKVTTVAECDMWTKYLQWVTSKMCLRWKVHVKRSEQCLHEYGFAPLWMRVKITTTFKQLPTVTTVIRSSVTVYLTYVCPQMTGLAETSLTQWTAVWFDSHVDFHVIVQSSGLTKCLVTHGTFVRFFSTVNCGVPNKTFRECKSLATNKTFKRFLSRMTSHVFC